MMWGRGMFRYRGNINVRCVFLHGQCFGVQGALRCLRFVTNYVAKMCNNVDTLPYSWSLQRFLHVSWICLQMIYMTYTHLSKSMGVPQIMRTPVWILIDGVLILQIFCVTIFLCVLSIGIHRQCREVDSWGTSPPTMTKILHHNLWEIKKEREKKVRERGKEREQNCV